MASSLIPGNAPSTRLAGALRTVMIGKGPLCSWTPPSWSCRRLPAGARCAPPPPAPPALRPDPPPCPPSPQTQPRPACLCHSCCREASLMTCTSAPHKLPQSHPVSSLHGEGGVVAGVRAGAGDRPGARHRPGGLRPQQQQHEAGGPAGRPGLGALPPRHAEGRQRCRCTPRRWPPRTPPPGPRPPSPPSFFTPPR